MGFVKKIGRVVHHVVSAPAKVILNPGHAIEKTIHEVVNLPKEILHTAEKIAKLPDKMIHSIVKAKVNKAFDQKMREEIDHVQKELDESKLKDKAQIDQLIKEKMATAADKFKNLTNTQTLAEEDLQLVQMIQEITAAVHDCRFGFKDSVEVILKLDADDYRVVEFLNKRPLLLTLENFAEHQNSEALAVLLPYFFSNFGELAFDNMNDYVFLKNYIKPAVDINKLTPIIADAAIAGKIKVIDNEIVNMEKLAATQSQTSTTAVLLSQLTVNATPAPTAQVETAPVVTNVSEPATVSTSTEQSVSPYSSRFLELAFKIKEDSIANELSANKLFTK